MNKNFNMKSIRIILGLLLFSCIFGCGVVDPIEGRTTFAINNTTQNDIRLVYMFSTDLGDWNAGKTDSAIVESKGTNIFILYGGGNPYLTPNRVLEKMVILSLDNDTLYNMDVIDDSEWILTDSIKDYGYKVGYYHWVFKFTD